jgi:hypothetical protein
MPSIIPEDSQANAPPKLSLKCALLETISERCDNNPVGRHVSDLAGITLLSGLRETPAIEEGNAGWVKHIIHRGEPIFVLLVHTELSLFA